MKAENLSFSELQIFYKYLLCNFALHCCYDNHTKRALLHRTVINSFSLHSITYFLLRKTLPTKDVRYKEVYILYCIQIFNKVSRAFWRIYEFLHNIGPTLI
jgi:hypothetical protein